jgi:hypothetical protein
LFGVGGGGGGGGGGGVGGGGGGGGWVLKVNLVINFGFVQAEQNHFFFFT